MMSDGDGGEISISLPQSLPSLVTAAAGAGSCRQAVRGNALWATRGS